MTADAFDEIQQTVHSRGSDAGIDLLVQKLKEEKNYPQLFEARMMRARHQLSLPLIYTGSIDDIPEDKRSAYEQAFTEAARETGSLFLADGNILRAWPYFRAIGDRAPVAEAIEKVETVEDGVLEMALEERVNPRKGFELMLQHLGICRAITYFEQYPDPKSREVCLALLVRTLHHELVENLRRAIAQREGQAPDTSHVPTLLAGRDWLFGDMDYYVDTSHLVSVIRYALDLTDPEMIRLALELCDYGAHLSPQFKFNVDPPFDDVYIDHAVYLRALAGQNVDDAVAHFHKKIASDSSTAPAQVLVALLVRLKRYREAIQVSIDHLSGVPPNQLVCPSALQLCQLAGDCELLARLARERGDLLSFTAAALDSSARIPSGHV